MRSRHALAGAVGLATLATASLALSQLRPLPAHPMFTPTPAAFLNQPIPPGPNADEITRGRDLAIAGDCLACHMRPGGRPFAGGYGVATPFGTVFSSNITSDVKTGIGGWSNVQFYRAMHDGVGAHGNLYPAFPYPWFRRISRADDDALFAYLKSTPAVDDTPPGNTLPFPLNIRFLMKGWNLLFFKTKDFQPDNAQSAEWNRGAYLVNGLGHCGACHTPKNLLGADKAGQDLHGGPLNFATAPNLTASPRSGLGGWSLDDITAYLKDGRNGRASASGDMADVVSYSTSRMSDQDRHAIAVYLKSLPAAPDPTPAAPDLAAMQRGAAIYSDACASCHLENGVGQPGLFPPLGHNAMVQQANTDGLEHIILAGARTAPTDGHPSPLAMPSFAWKLNDQEIADVATFLRNSWGNQASGITADQVQHLRSKMKLGQGRLTVNSGDHN